MLGQPGAMSSSIASRSSLVSAALATQKAFMARVSNVPARSHASSTLATVAGAVSSAISSSSRRWAAMPCSIASRKSASVRLA